jgi:ferric-dicitrate binding protein FerR (iron transport regulator)
MHPGRNRIAPALVWAPVVAMVVLVMWSSTASARQAGSIGVVSAVFGVAEITHKDEAKPTLITRRQKVYPMDKIETKEDAKVRILFEDGSLLTIAEKTTIEINEFVYSPLDKVRASRLSLALGKMRVVATNLLGYRNRNFVVNTPTATIGARGTEHIDHVYRDKATGQLVTVVAVLEGEVGVVNPKFPTIEEVVKKLEYTTVNPGVGGALLGGGAPDALGVNKGNVEIHWQLP